MSIEKDMTFNEFEIRGKKLKLVNYTRALDLCSRIIHLTPDFLLVQTRSVV